MSGLAMSLAEFEKEISNALILSAQLARETAIKTNTGIVVIENDQIIEITAAELKQQMNQAEIDAVI